MKINFTQTINDARGNAIKNNDDTDLTLRDVCSGAMFAMLPNDDQLSGNRKAEIGALGLKLFDSEELDLKSEQVTLIKERVGKMWNPLVVARAHALLDPSA